FRHGAAAITLRLTKRIRIIDQYARGLRAHAVPERFRHRIEIMEDNAWWRGTLFRLAHLAPFFGELARISGDVFGCGTNGRRAHDEACRHPRHADRIEAFDHLLDKCGEACTLILIFDAA